MKTAPNLETLGLHGKRDTARQLTHQGSCRGWKPNRIATPRIRSVHPRCDWQCDPSSRIPAATYDLLAQCPVRNLLILIEGADMLLPAGDGDVSRLNDTQQRRIAIVTALVRRSGFLYGSRHGLFDCGIKKLDPSARQSFATGIVGRDTSSRYRSTQALYSMDRELPWQNASTAMVRVRPVVTIGWPQPRPV